MSRIDANLGLPIPIEASVVSGAVNGMFTPGQGASQWFKDHADGPRMVVVPAGQCMIGSPPTEERWPGYDGREEPRHLVSIRRPFAACATPITRGEFKAFVSATGYQTEPGGFVWRRRRWRWWVKEWQFEHSINWQDPGYVQTDEHPVVCVSWNDAKAYADWLSQVTGGKGYRLLSEAEWEYCCRAGSTTAYSTGDEITQQQANFGANHTTTPGFRYPPNAWGLCDTHGNVWEWVEDGWHPDYSGEPPLDGSAWPGGDDELRGLRGGRWDHSRIHFRSADRGRGPHWLRNCVVGFRLARVI